MFSEDQIALALWPALALFLAALPWLRPHDPFIRRLLCVFVALTNLCYLAWRWEMLHADGPVQGAWVMWTYFAIETVALLDATVFWICMSRSDEARENARSQVDWPPPGQWPLVEVWIPTYKEPLEVLEKAILAACGIDYPRLKVRVLDDGSRDWLRQWCEARGIEHVTRAQHLHAKAGNLNNALETSQAEFVVVMDADFAAHRDYVRAALPQFADPRVAILQTPQTFYNPDLAQQNLGLGGGIADEQALFFRELQPCRDAFDAAFYCGSCAMLRVSALREIGGVPTGSLTEDLLTSLVMLGRGWKTRYLNRALSIGLAAESIEGFFVQRDRWCRGALEILFHPHGPLRHRQMTLMQRLLFMPSYWLISPVLHLALIVLPALCLFTNASILGPGQQSDSVGMVMAMVLINLSVLTWITRRRFSPIISTAVAMVIATRLIRSAIFGLLRPGKLEFKVTPKGSQVSASVDRPVFLFFIGISVCTIIGMVWGVWIHPQAGEIGAADSWVLLVAVYNLLHLLIALVLVEDRPRQRAEERFAVNADLPVRWEGREVVARVIDLSANGVKFVLPDQAAAPDAQGGCEIRLASHWYPLQVRRSRAGPAGLEVAASIGEIDQARRAALIQFLFSGEFPPLVQARPRVWAALTHTARVVLGLRPA